MATKFDKCNTGIILFTWSYLRISSFIIPPSLLYLEDHPSKSAVRATPMYKRWTVIWKGCSTPALGNLRSPWLHWNWDYPPSEQRSKLFMTFHYIHYTDWFIGIFYIGLYNPHIGCFQKIGIPQNGWFVMENPIKRDDLGIPIIFGNTYIIPLYGFLS